MRQLPACMLMLCIVMAVGCTSVETYTNPNYQFGSIAKVAIVDVTGRLDEGSRNQIGDFFTMGIMKKGYSVIERQQVKQMLAEQQFQQGDITTNQDAARAGRVLNVPAVVLVNMSELAEEMMLTAKLIDVETAEITWVGSVSGSTGRTVATVAGGAAGVAAGVALGGSSSGRLVGGVAGGAVGALGARALTPSEISHVRKMANKITLEFPPRMAAAP